ncbi:MAG: malate dehydrogenase, partial [Propionibacteriales bacterium]
MSRHPFEFVTEDGVETVRVYARGADVLGNPMINFGTAFTEQERQDLGIEGLLPSGRISLNTQLKRVYRQFRRQPTDLSKYLYLNTMQDRNEILYYRLITDHVEEMLPIIYTPTIGQAIQQYIADIRVAFENLMLGPDDVDLIVATDSEGILGIGDQGVGGVAIAVGKSAVYTAAAGIHPHRVLQVVLDPGTDNLDLLSDDGYLGARHARVRGKAYDEFVAEYVRVVTEMFPKAMLHWEDFGASNARRVLETYRHVAPSFNDDIQGTAAVVVAALLGAVRASDRPLEQHKIVIHGAGTAGTGIADLLVTIMEADGMSREEAQSRFWCLGRRGLLREGLRMRDFQAPYARPLSELESWQYSGGMPNYRLREVMKNVQPTILIGTSARPGAFGEDIITQMT